MAETTDTALVAALHNAAHWLTAGSILRDMNTTLTDLVHAAVATTPNADGGGISRSDGHAITTSYATAAGACQLNELQDEVGQGPCIVAANAPEASIVLAQDLAGGYDTDRWPAFAPNAALAGFRSLISIQFSISEHARSALVLYASEPNAFNASDQLNAGFFSLQAAMLFRGFEHANHLSQAMATRDVIGQAKGILMERFRIDDVAAFRKLVDSSQETNMKLIDVARWLTQQTCC